MNFIRPELRATLWRWREVILCAILILFGIRMLGQGWAGGSFFQTTLGLILSVLFAVLMSYAVLRAKLTKPIKAAGVVEITEREVGYLTPEGGAFVSLDDLTRLEIISTDRRSQDNETFWLLTHTAGPALLIPASAKGAEKLFDAFAALPKVDFELAARSMGGTESDRAVIWEKRVLH